MDEPTVCRWVEDEPAIDWEGIWGTDCGHSFIFDEEGPEENEFKCCPFCGKPIEAVPYVEEGAGNAI